MAAGPRKKDTLICLIFSVRVNHPTSEVEATLTQCAYCESRECETN